MHALYYDFHICRSKDSQKYLRKLCEVPVVRRKFGTLLSQLLGKNFYLKYRVFQVWFVNLKLLHLRLL